MYLVWFGNLPSHTGCGVDGIVSFRFNIYFVGSLQIEQVHDAHTHTTHTLTFHANILFKLLCAQCTMNALMGSEPKPTVKQT